MNITANPDAFEALKAEVEQMVDQGTKVSLAADMSVAKEPKQFVAYAQTMLGIARNRLIRADAIYHARRAAEILKAKDRLLQMDAEHDKLVSELANLIDKLEAMRS